MMLPRSRRRLTHPMRTAFLPASDKRRAPHMCVRFKSPKKSSKLYLSERNTAKSRIKDYKRRGQDSWARAAIEIIWRLGRPRAGQQTRAYAATFFARKLVT